jgi:hypothetical protein
MTRSGVRISIVDVDEHLLKMRVQASNGIFSGQADLYADSEEIGEFANALRGFPDRNRRSCEFQLGNVDPGYAGGSVCFRFRCVDSSGHVLAGVRLRTEPLPDNDECETAGFFIAVEPAAIDSFVGELERVKAEAGQTAALSAIRNEL